MKSKTTKTMRAGFICRSPVDTAVCMTGDPRSVVVPRRPDRTMLVDQKRLVNVAKYSRLQAESRRPTLPPSPVLERRASVIVRPSIKKGQNQEQDEPTVRFHKPSSLTPTDNVFQVVVMRVSLHCQGCAGKVKKHLSKMEGVTSFSIDLETKRVTVMGHVSPALVLESVSKVKKAEFWPC